MSKHFFIKFVTSPDVDPLKCLVGLGCAAQAINDGHKVDIFFAAAAVQMLHAEYLSKLEKAIDAPAGMSQSFIDTIKKENFGIENDSYSSETELFGGKSSLDSLGLVTLIVALEQNIEDELGIAITIADEKAMSQEHSPFKTVGSLADYIEMILKDNLNV